MNNPITPLTPEQTANQEAKAAKEGWVKRDLVAIDQTANVVILKGQPDETISSHAARASLQGKKWGKAMSWFLNLFQKDHAAKAVAGDDERAQALAQREENSGAINAPSD